MATDHISDEEGYVLEDVNRLHPGAVQALCALPWAQDFIDKHGEDDFYAAIGFTDRAVEGASQDGILRAWSWEGKWIPNVEPLEWRSGRWVPIPQ